MALGQIAVMNDQAFQRTACILHLKQPGWSGEIAPVSNLATAFGIERCAVKNNQSLLRRANAFNFYAVDHQANDVAGASNALVAGECGGTDALQDIGQGPIVLGLHKSTGRTAAFLLAL